MTRGAPGVPGGRANARLKTCLKMLGRFAEDVMLPPQIATAAMVGRRVNIELIQEEGLELFHDEAGQ